MAPRLTGLSAKAVQQGREDDKAKKERLYRFFHLARFIDAIGLPDQEMTRYRIPYHMFLKWFVPYSRRGNFLMAALLVPALGLTVLCCGAGLGALWGLVFLQLIWGSVSLNYHRRESFTRWLLANGIGVGILILAFYLTKDSLPFSAPVPPVFLLWTEIGIFGLLDGGLKNIQATRIDLYAF